MHTIDSILHLLVIPFAGDLDLLSQIAAADKPRMRVAFSDWQQDGVQHLVDALHDSGVGALELLGFATFRKLPS